MVWFLVGNRTYRLTIVGCQLTYTYNVLVVIVWQILEPLELCYRSLCETGDKPIADGSLLDFMRQVSCFGLSLVKLDIRQESDRHTDVIDAITNHLGIGSYRNWTEEQRQVCSRTRICCEE